MAASGVPALARGQALRPASRALPRPSTQHPAPSTEHRAPSTEHQAPRRHAHYRCSLSAGGNGSATCPTSFVNKCRGLTAGPAVAREAVGTLPCLFHLRPCVRCLWECPGGPHPPSWWREVCSALIRPPLAALAQSLRFFELKPSPLGAKRAGGRRRGSRAETEGYGAYSPNGRLVSGQRLPDGHSPLLCGAPFLPGEGCRSRGRRDPGGVSRPSLRHSARSSRGILFPAGRDVSFSIHCFVVLIKRPHLRGKARKVRKSARRAAGVSQDASPEVTGAGRGRQPLPSRGHAWPSPDA